jgi:hypothetical protein
MCRTIQFKLCVKQLYTIPAKESPIWIKKMHCKSAKLVYVFEMQYIQKQDAENKVTRNSTTIPSCQ